MLPRHGHVFHQLDDSMRHILESSQVHTLVMAKLLARHVSMVCNDFSNMLWRKVFLLRFCVSLQSQKWRKIKLIPYFRLSAYRFDCSCCHLRAEKVTLTENNVWTFLLQLLLRRRRVWTLLRHPHGGGASLGHTSKELWER